MNIVLQPKTGGGHEVNKKWVGKDAARILETIGVHEMCIRDSSGALGGHDAGQICVGTCNDVDACLLYTSRCV